MDSIDRAPESEGRAGTPSWAVAEPDNTIDESKTAARHEWDFIYVIIVDSSNAIADGPARGRRQWVGPDVDIVRASSCD